jgi:hypothetical protein
METQSIAATLGHIHPAEAIAYGPFTIVPLLGSQERQLAYTGLARAFEKGRLAITEVSEGGTVNTLRAVNKGHKPVLILAGEQLEGAKQNRIINLTVLLPAESETLLPASCVEQHRWGYRSKRDFSPVATMLHYKSRSKAVENVRERVKANMAPDADQGMIWDDVAQLKSKLKAEAPTASLHDVFRSRTVPFDKMLAAVPAISNQQGIMVYHDGRFLGLDYVSRPKVYAGLHRKLLHSYVFELLEKTYTAEPVKNGAPGVEEGLSILSFLAPAGGKPIGIGEPYSVRVNDHTGTGLRVGQEWVHLGLNRLEDPENWFGRKHPRFMNF